MSDFHWMAGFFDGEGSVSLKVIKHPTKKTIVGVYLQVSNKYREPLDIFKRYFKGSIHINMQSGRPFYKWTLAGRLRVEKFLNEVGALCVVKARQIKLAHRACAIQGKRGIGKRVRYSQSSILKLRRIRARIIKVNDRYKAT